MSGTAAGAPAPAEWDAPREAAAISGLRAAVAAFARGAGLPDATADEVALAISEACANAVAHAGPGRDRLRLRGERVGDEVRITVADFCRTDDICHVRARALDDIRPGGLGVHYMECLMDHVEFLADRSGWAALRLTRCLPAPREGEARS